MTTDLAFTVFRIGFLVLLWIMVFGVVATLRSDIYGTVVTRRGSGRAASEDKKKSAKKERKAALSRQPSKLMITDGPLTGTLIPLGTAPITIGRSPSSTLVLDDPYVSTRHAELRQLDGEWTLIDLGSTNGTFVEDERVFQPIILTTGVSARIGQTSFELVS
ncbi:FHA domain-containing protein FhaB/FipA [Actinomyces minihominis]|uniref:FHA domain-containing protein FhaB/FipA n=1 Tax=Actinomyces minihominis TaxID=2002838 RepID=UPI000C069919|nr:FHA domain-containing protein [Actinomyces minihominis]